MTIKQTVQLQTPTRSVSEFTVGNSDNKPDLSTAATSPTVGGLNKNPAAWIVVGVASETFTAITSAVSANSYGLVVNNQRIPVSNLMPGNTAVTFGPKDQVYINASINDIVSIPVTGININAIQVTPYGVTSDKVVIRGPVLFPNVQYTAFGVFLSIYAYCTNTVAANLSYVVRVDAMLLNLPG